MALSCAPTFRYFMYLRPTDLQRLLAEPLMQSWVRRSVLHFIKWDVVPVHPRAPYWDQRLTYGHAVLSHLGRQTYLFMIDLDEYVSGTCVHACAHMLWLHSPCNMKLPL